MTESAIVQLPWSKPPLSMNDRPHHMTRARLTKGMRRDAHMLADDSRLPRGLDRVQVALHYRPRDRRRRDSDNLMPVLKALCDGLVDYGLVADDTPELMTKLMPVIEQPEKGKGGAMWLEIVWTAPGGVEGGSPTPIPTNAENERQRPAQAAGTGIALDTKDHQ
jgi:Holliday junction resolvase RusA-like endonuclease